MYASRTTQIIVGIFAISELPRWDFVVRWASHIFPTPGYTLSANFDNIAGFKTGDQVQLAGVKIGKDDGSGSRTCAQGWMHVNDGVPIDNEAIASI